MIQLVSSTEPVFRALVSRRHVVRRVSTTLAYWVECFLSLPLDPLVTLSSSHFTWGKIASECKVTFERYRMCTHTHIQAHTHTYTHTHMHTRTHTQRQHTFMHTNIPQYVYTYSTVYIRLPVAYSMMSVQVVCTVERKASPVPVQLH